MRKTFSLQAMARQTASIRDLRDQFAKVRKLVEIHGAVVVTDRGKPRYKLMLYRPGRKRGAVVKDYMARITRYQPHPFGEHETNVLHVNNRGDR